MSQTFILHANDPGRERVLLNLIAFLQRLPEDKGWEVEIARYVKARTDKQRKAMFGAAYKALMEFSGLEGSREKEQLHRDMCGEFYGWTNDALGRRKPVRTTTTNERGERDEISIEEQLKFYAFLQRQGAEVGCYVPDPDPFWRERQ